MFDLQRFTRPRRAIGGSGAVGASRSFGSTSAARALSAAAVVAMTTVVAVMTVLAPATADGRADGNADGSSDLAAPLFEANAGAGEATGTSLHAGDTSVHPHGTSFTVHTMTDKKKLTDDSVDRTQVLTTCESWTPRCTLTTTTTNSRTMELPSGVSRRWAAAQLGIPFAAAETVSVDCTSPPLSAGQTWTAYALGTRWSYTIESQHYAVDEFGRYRLVGEPLSSGTLYAFDPAGYSCQS